jgi:hypothetical protein
MNRTLLSYPGYANVMGGEPVMMTVFPAKPRTAEPGVFRPRVAMVFMHNGECHPGAARGYYRAKWENRDVDVVAEMEVVSSFVPQAYNIGLHHALELRDQGIATHFAMMHADISPEPTWLDGLWRDTQASKADAIAAVAPIKEPEHEFVREAAEGGGQAVRMRVGINRTTTVIGDPGNPWIPKRSVHIGDQTVLPPVFDITNVGDPSIEFLQINTGCMLLDLRRDWWDIPRAGGTGDFFAFELMQQVVRVNKPAEHYAAELDHWRAEIAALEAAGETDHASHLRHRKPLPFVRQTQSRSEDWEMSRHIWQHGGKCAATFGVTLDHFGAFAWSNQARTLVKEA